jgi:hypothetical protein
MKIMESQNKRLLKLLNKGGRVNLLSSWKKLGIYRLSARIYDLRQKGYKISDRWIQVCNRFDEEVSIKEYYIEKKLK